MRARTLGLFALAGSGAAWLLRSRRARVTDTSSSAESSFDEPRSITQARVLDDAHAAVAADDTVREGADFDDVAADPDELVQVERDLLTVPGEVGEGHRRRDQTAGVAAREIAAAQVRQRRYGVADVD